ncbi:MAG: hypothetical protein AAGG47_22080 [Pseudomonadota bacterium]
MDFDKIDLQLEPTAGELLEGIDIPGADAFEDWLRRERRRDHGQSADFPVRESSLLLRAEIPDEMVLVLPFTLSKFAAQQTPLGDAIAEDVARRVSRTRLIDVISHLSARELSQRRDGMPGATELGVSYVLSGSISETAHGIEAVVDLHDLARRRLLWSREFFCNPDEPFLHPDSITSEIARQVLFTICDRATQAARARPLHSLTSQALLIAAVAEMHSPSPERFVHAGTLLEEALRRDTKQADLCAWRGKWHVMRVQRSLSPAPDRDRSEALAFASRALDLDPHCVLALTTRGFVHSHLMADFETAENEYRGALTIDPSHALAQLLLGAVSAFRDVPDKAIAHTERARRLSPLDPESYYYDSLSATAQLCGKHFEAALSLAERSLAVNPNHPSTLRVRVIALQMMDRGDDARQAVRDLLAIEPKLTVGGYLSQHPAAQSKSGKLFADALAEAGVPK